MSGQLQRNFRYVSIAILGVALIQYALYFLIARYLGTSEYGSFAVALTMALLACPLCQLGMNVSLLWSHSRDPDRLHEFVGASLFVRLLLTIPVGILAIWLGATLGFSQETLWMFVPLFLGANFDGVSGLFSAVFQAKEQMGWSSAILLVRNMARAVGLGSTLLLGGDLWTLALSWLLASAAGTAFSALLVMWHMRIHFRLRTAWPVVRDALPFGSAIVANLLLLQADVLMLGHFAGETAVGVYHAAIRFVVLAEMLPHVISMVIVPRSFRIGHLEGVASLSRFYRVQTLALASLGILGSLVLALHGETLTSWTLGGAYHNSGAILTVLAPMIFLRFMSVPLGDALSSLGYQRRLSQAAWLSCAANVALNLALIPSHGALGAAVATCCSQICMLALQMFFAREAKLQLDWQRVLVHPLIAGAGVSALFTFTAIPATWLVPIAVVILYALSRAAPSAEHRSLLRSTPTRIRGTAGSIAADRA